MTQRSLEVRTQLTIRNVQTTEAHARADAAKVAMEKVLEETKRHLTAKNKQVDDINRELRNSKDTLQLEKQHHSSNLEQMKLSIQSLEADKRELIMEVNRLTKEARLCSHHCRKLMLTVVVHQGGSNLQAVRAARDQSDEMEHRLADEQAKMQEEKERLLQNLKDARDAERRTNDKAIAAAERALATLHDLETTRAALKQKTKDMAQAAVRCKLSSLQLTHVKLTFLVCCQLDNAKALQEAQRKENEWMEVRPGPGCRVRCCFNHTHGRRKQKQTMRRCLPRKLHSVRLWKPCTRCKRT